LKDDVFAGGISDRIYRSRRFCSFCVRMDTHAAEIMAEASFEKCARRCVEGLTGKSKHVMNN
jgi:hypothetical protein